MHYVEEGLYFSVVILISADFWLQADVDSYRICSFVLAQDCPRIDGVRRLMVYST